MKPKVFWSFHFDQDCWRSNQVRNIGAIEGNIPVSGNDWEKVKKGGDAAIEKWIDEQLKSRECAVVLVGAFTASRQWVMHEIKRAWRLGIGVVGIRIHDLEDSDGNQSAAGSNPFSTLTLDGVPFDQIVKLHNPPFLTSKKVYANIEENISDWVNEAMKTRKKYS
jgi:MTH538 TIR-like domain (DUF1863)